MTYSASEGMTKCAVGLGLIGSEGSVEPTLYMASPETTDSSGELEPTRQTGEPARIAASKLSLPSRRPANGFTDYWPRRGRGASTSPSPWDCSCQSPEDVGGARTLGRLRTDPRI